MSIRDGNRDAAILECSYAATDDFRSGTAGWPASVRDVTRASQRWQTLSRKKLAELDGLMDGIKTVRRLLKKMMQNCRCDTLEQCGKGIFQSGRADVAVKSLPLKRRRSP